MVFVKSVRPTAVTKPKFSADQAKIPRGKCMAKRSQGSHSPKPVFELPSDAGARGWRAGEGVPTLGITFF